MEIRTNGKLKASIKRGSSNGYAHRAYTFTPNGKQIISGGGNGVLAVYNAQGKQQGQFIGHTGDIWAVAVSPNGRTLISGSADQTLRLWRIKTQELLLTLFTGNKGEWVAWTPQGYYSASTKGDQLIGWQINRGANQAADYASAQQLRRHFYRPDIIDNTLRLGSARQAVAQASNTEFQLADLLKKGLPPQFTLHQPRNGATVRQQQQKIILSFSQKTKADSLEAYVNGVQVLSRGKMALPTPNRLHQASQRSLTLPLKVGKNAIRIVAHNRVGQSERHFILYYKGRESAQKGRLFLVAIGVSD